jgi:hypothetical protein
VRELLVMAAGARVIQLAAADQPRRLAAQRIVETGL